MTGLILQALIIAAVTIAALWLYARVTAPTPGACRVTFVYDGDTVAMDCGAGDIAARIQGLNAPETRDALCEAERQAGLRATTRLRALIKDAPVSISRMGQERYGRELIRLWVDGRDAADILVAEGLAEPYFGGHRRDWCVQ